MMKTLPCVVGLAVFLGGSSRALGDKHKLVPLKEEVPESVAPPLKAAVGPEGLRVLDSGGKPYVDVWLRKELPTVKAQEDPEIQFGQIREGGFLGVMRVHRRIKDYKGKTLRAGTYTMRWGVMPQDGDHLGVAESRDFVLLSPVNIDVKIAPMSTDDLVKLSVKASKTKHPSTLYLVKPPGKAGQSPRVVEDEANERWILDCQVKASGDSSKAVRLGIVVAGVSPTL